MDQNLEDSLALESSMGVDFEHPVAGEEIRGDMSLNVSGHEEGISMEFEHIEGQPTLMDTGSEEIIGHDFMEDQFGLQEYSVVDDQITAETNCSTYDHNMKDQQITLQSDDINLHGVTLQDDQPMFSSSSNTLPDLQYELQQSQDVIPKLVSIQTAPQFRNIAAKKDVIVLTKTTAPKQVAIAPKLPKLVQAKVGQANTFVARKQYAIAPKPVPFISKTPTNVIKKISIPGTVPANNTVLAPSGKQFVVMPGSSQKYKLVSAGSSMKLVTGTGEQPRLFSAKYEPTESPPRNMNYTPVKVILKGQGSGEGGNQKILTKLIQTSTGSTPARYVTMQQKTVPIKDKNVIMASPTKEGIKFTQKKSQIIAIKSPAKIAPAVSGQATTTKKVIITANPSQNVILKTTAPPKTGQITSVTAGQKSTLHQINVPGKGIQYIRLLTNPTSQTSAAPAPVKASKPITLSYTNKTFVLNKNEIIEMTEKTGQPPPLVITSSAFKDVTSKPQHKFVRIAPISSKTQVTMSQARSGQSLLAPRSPAPSQKITLDDVQSLLEAKVEMNEEDPPEQTERPEREEEEVDSKTALRALIADAVGEDLIGQDESNDHMDYGKSQESRHDENSAGEDMEDPEHPLIVVPSYGKNDSTYSQQDFSTQQQDESRMLNTMVNFEVDPVGLFDTPSSPRELLDNDGISADLMMRPRKACNCTKSQCLKLYCDCFANGEFCNRCNCNNCYNNLENEELRQKAIRGCLDRNPNAFRPKIGKTKAGGPEIIRRHNKGCNCKRSGCLKNYCECYEAKIACSGICKCVGCRNVEEGEGRRHAAARHQGAGPGAGPRAAIHDKQPITFMTQEVISAVCQCLFAAAVEGPAPARAVLDEFARCLHDIVSAAHHAQAHA